MRKYLLILFIFIYNVNFLIAQENRDKIYNEYYKENLANTIIKTNPFTILNGPIIYTSEYRLAVEKVTFKKQSFQFDVSILGKGPVLRSLERTDTNFTQNHTKLNVFGYRLQFSYKIYFSKKTFKGFYVAPHYSYSSVKFRDSNQPQKDTFIQAIYINYAIKGGYQFIINRTIALDLFFGYGYKENSWYEVRNNNYKNSDETNAYIFPEPIKIYLGLNIGIAF